MEIKLLSTKDYAELCGVTRQTVWKWVKNDSQIYFTLPGSKRKWFPTEEVTIRRILNIGLGI